MPELIFVIDSDKYRYKKDILKANIDTFTSTVKYHQYLKTLTTYVRSLKHKRKTKTNYVQQWTICENLKVNYGNCSINKY